MSILFIGKTHSVFESTQTYLTSISQGNTYISCVHLSKATQQNTINKYGVFDGIPFYF